MSGSPVCLRYEISNKHDCRAPSGCTFPKNKKEPKIAVGENIGSFAAALLVKDERLMEILSEITSRSATLKAWFAFRLKTRGNMTLGAKVPQWRLVWDILQRKGAAWTAQLRKFMDYENPVFQLHAIGSTQAAVPKPASASHRDYRTHSIFKLEDIAAQLSCDSRDEAEHLFALVRRNHKCSGVFIQDLMDLFAPLRDRVDREWEQVEDLMTLCEKGVNMNAQTALGFRDWVGHLSDPTQQTQARIYLDLIGTNSPLMSHGIGELCSGRIMGSGKISVA